jgi:hypothetical protein
MSIQKNGDEKGPVHEVDLDEVSDQSMSYIVVSSIADLTGQDPDGLEPLWNTMDPEALDSFVAHASESSTSYQLAFQYQGYTVKIAKNRWIRFIENEKIRSSASV